MWCVMGKLPHEIFVAWAEDFRGAYVAAMEMIAHGIPCTIFPPVATEA